MLRNRGGYSHATVSRAYGVRGRGARVGTMQPPPCAPLC